MFYDISQFIVMLCSVLFATHSFGSDYAKSSRWKVMIDHQGSFQFDVEEGPRGGLYLTVSGCTGLPRDLASLSSNWKTRRTR